MSDNPTRLPEALKGAVEGLSGVSMDGAQVHHASDGPVQLDAQVHSQGSEIHLGPGQRQVRPAREVDDRAGGRGEKAAVQGAPRFVAFSTIDNEPWEAGGNASDLLDRVRELASLGIGLVRFTEILDCGADASDVLTQGTSLADARARFPTVFRGEGVTGLPPVKLESESVIFDPEHRVGAA